MKRKGSIIAGIIETEMRREEYFKNKVRRMKCKLDNKMQCDICKYKENCEDKEE